MTRVRFPKPIRLPRESYENPENVFHLVIRTFPETLPFRGSTLNSAVWDRLLDQDGRRGIELLAACLMPDHLHLLAKPAGTNIIDWLGALKSVTTRIAWQSGWHGRLWQPSFWDRRIRDEREWESTLFYVRRNPVEAGLVADESDWPWLGIWLDR
ncbi:MAG: transposase [Dehalococcoidia bacterium]|nr:transposase [Dehalococcoidia bacterium]